MSTHQPDPTLDLPDGSRVAQVMVHINDTLHKVHMLAPAPGPASTLTRLLRGGWALLAAAPLALLLGLPGLTALLALAGMTTGMVGTLRHRASRGPTRFTVGASPGADLCLDLPALPPCFPLITAAPDGQTLHFHREMQGRVSANGVWRALDELARLDRVGPSPMAPGALAYRIPPLTQVEVNLGPIRVQLVSVAAPRQLRPPPVRIGWRGQRFNACSLGIHVAVIVAALLAPARAQRKPVPQKPLCVRTARVVIVPTRGEPVPFFPSFLRSRSPLVGNTRDPRAKTGLYGLRGPINNPDPHLARRRDLLRDEARRERLGKKIAFMGRLGPGLVVGSPAIRGPRDREIVRRIIRRHHNEVVYCRQNVLQANPNLHGRVVVRFVIDGSGRVARSAILSSTLANQTVEACLAQAARRWRYPRIAGGVTEVEVPFIFRW